MISSTLDIILPCYNPQPQWAQNVLTKYKEILNRLPEINIHLLVVNDGSTKNISDDDINFLKKNIPYFTYLSYAQNTGKGFALREGVKNSTAEIILYTDVDFPYTAESFLTVFNLLREDAFDVVAGIKDKEYYRHVPPARKFISELLRTVTRIFLRLKITDTQCGLKGFNEKGKIIFLSTTINRYLFDLEFIYLASKNKQIKLTPAEVTLRGDVNFSKMNRTILFTEAFNFMRIFFKNIFGL